MLEITEQEIQDRLAFDNPWWESGEGIQPIYAKYPRRLYFEPFRLLVADSSVNRAVILLGPRRVGKTVMVYHTIQSLLDQDIRGDQILYLSLETPLYTGISLEKIVLMFRNRFAHSRDAHLFIFFDEVQYLKEWEVHLKSLVDSYPSIRFVATGSAAAALKVKSRESGAGRFTDFLLPPLSFAEYLIFTGQETDLILPDSQFPLVYGTTDILRLNDAFIDYINFGGYPEAVFVRAVRHDSSRYIKNDVIDKVLLRDLPSLYGITDIQELNRLFTVLAYNTGNEVSYENLTKSSGVTKNTVKKYLEYLEAAFLIRRLYPLGKKAERFQRDSQFKVHLTNPSMRAALFGPIDAEAPAMGAMNETAIISQWQHEGWYNEYLHYARWKEGEVDLVGIDSTDRKPRWCTEIKWSDRPFHNHRELKHLLSFAINNNVDDDIVMTTRTVSGKELIDEKEVKFIPSSQLCYSIGKNVLSELKENNQRLVNNPNV
ncbi:MAG: ATP-binding protein [Candidatus Kapaibacterium sp.]